MYDVVAMEKSANTRFQSERGQASRTLLALREAKNSDLHRQPRPKTLF